MLIPNSLWRKNRINPNKPVISTENCRESTCHPCQSPSFFFFFERHVMVSVLKAKVKTMSSVSDSLLWMRQEKVLEFECCMFQNPHVRGISKAENKTWSFLEAASSHSLPTPWLLKRFTVLPPPSVKTSPFSSWHHSKLCHFLTFLSYLEGYAKLFVTPFPKKPHYFPMRTPPRLIFSLISDNN